MCGDNMSYEELLEYNKLLTDEIADSALYYGNLTVDEFKTIILRIMNQATKRGYDCATNS